MNELLQVLGLDGRVQRAIDQLQARIGEWLALPNQLRLAADRAADPVAQQQIAALQATYARTKPTVERGLAIAQQAAATRTLPGLADVGVVIEAAAAVADTTKAARAINAGGTAVTTVGTGTTSGFWLKLVGGGALLWGGYQLVQRSRRRRRK